MQEPTRKYQLANDADPEPISRVNIGYSHNKVSVFDAAQYSAPVSSNILMNIGPNPQSSDCGYFFVRQRQQHGTQGGQAQRIPPCM